MRISVVIDRVEDPRAAEAKPTNGNVRIEVHPDLTTCLNECPHVPRVANLGHVREVERGRDRMAEAGLDAVQPSFVEGFESNPLLLPEAGRFGPIALEEFDTAADPVAVIDAGAVAELGGKGWEGSGTDRGGGHRHLGRGQVSEG